MSGRQVLILDTKKGPGLIQGPFRWGFANELLMTRSSQQISKGLSGLGLHSRADVTVHCHREGGVSMAKPLLDNFGMGTRADQAGCMNVSKVMEPEARVSRFPR